MVHNVVVGGDEWLHGQWDLKLKGEPPRAFSEEHRNLEENSRVPKLEHQQFDIYKHQMQTPHLPAYTDGNTVSGTQNRYSKQNPLPICSAQLEHMV